MSIKQWLQEDLQKCTCQIVINELLWSIGKTVEKKVEESIYQDLLDLEYHPEAEERFAAYLAGAKARNIPLQNTMTSDGKIVVGYYHDLARTLLVENLQTLVREKYATI